MGKNWKSDTLILNASKDRGIDVIRKDIIDFAKTVGFNDAGFKIIFLDEADSLTPAAQTALRNTMEEYSNNVSFILTCNYPERIIEPIKSRCQHYNFKPISIEQATILILKIINKENIHIEPYLAEELAKKSNGDMRPILYELEKFKALDREITIDDISSLNENELNKLFEDILVISSSKEYISCKQRFIKLLKDGETPKNLLIKFYEFVNNTPMQSSDKLKLFLIIRDCDRNIAHGTTPEIQCVGLITEIYVNNLNKK